MKKQTARLVREIPASAILVSDSQDIRETLESIGIKDNGQWGCLFAIVGDGDYTAVWGCGSSVPYTFLSVTSLYPNTAKYLRG